MSYSVQKTCQISPAISFRRHKFIQSTKHQKDPIRCCGAKTRCLSCIMNDPDPSSRRSGLAKCFGQLHHQAGEDDDDPEAIIATGTLSGLWSIALANPDDAEFPSMGIFECMAQLIDRCINDAKWASRGKNYACVPYYAAHIIGSYTMNKARLADMAVKSGVVPPLMELLKGKISWVEQRVAVRALGHIASHRSTFKAIAVHEEEIIELAMKISSTCFDTVHTQFLGLRAEERVAYHRDLMRRGHKCVEMENRKAEEWAGQLQSWSLYLLNCFAVNKRGSSVNLICEENFLHELCGMWGGLQNTSSFSGVCLIRSVCLCDDGRRSVANSRAVLESLCNLCRSSDEGQRKAIESILLLLRDQETRAKVIHLVVHFMLDLVELRIVRGGRITRVGDTITRLLLQDYGRIKYGQMVLKNKKSQSPFEAVWNLKVERRKKDDMMSEKEFRERKAAVGKLKREGNERFWSGEGEEAAAKYGEALDLCPLKMKKERIVLHSNRAQCYLLLREAESAVSDTTRALCLSGAERPHLKSLWRRSQAYDMLGMGRQSLMDCLVFINQKTKFKRKRQDVKFPYYAVRMLNKQISATNPFGNYSLSAKLKK